MKAINSDSLLTSENVTDNSESVLTVLEVARELKCSKGHVYNIIRNRVPGLKPLPVIALGRKKLIRRAALEAWKRANETNTLGDTPLAEPEINTVGA